MNPLLIYTVKTAVYLASFYLVFRIFLHRDTMHSRNRAFIILSVLASIVLPLITVHTSKPLNFIDTGKFLSDLSITGGESATSPVGNAVVPVSVIIKWVSIIYVAGLLFFLAKFAVDLAELIIFIVRKRSSNSNLIRVQGLRTSGFSALGHIFVSDGLTQREEDEIIRHEQNHLRHNHSTDIIFIELVKVLQWFNPAIYLFKKSLRAVHEYQADQECISEGASVNDYQKILLNQVFKSRVFRISNSFANPSMVKQRMMMMSKKPTRSLANLKLLIVVPVTAFVLLAFSTCTEQNSHTRVTQQEMAPPASPVSDTRAEVQEKSDTEPYVVVEEMPMFPGGEMALLKFLTDNINYPESAKKAGIEGKVIVRFCIDEEGRTSLVSVLKAVDPDLDAEAIRVVSALPRFQPGRQSGKPVPVWFMLPVSFALK